MSDADLPRKAPLPDAPPEILAAARRFVSDLDTLHRIIHRPDYEELRFAAWTVLRQARAQKRAQIPGGK